MKARDLIAGLEALCAPDAEVYFFDDGRILEVEGGLLDVEEGSGREGVLLTAESCRVSGGF